MLLITVGPDGRRREFPLEGEEVVVGRDDGRPESGRILIPEDPHLSRRQFKLVREGERVTVERCQGARNPLFFQGTEQDRFQVSPGEIFLCGRTKFATADRSSHTVAFTLVHQAKEKARMRRLQDCFEAVLKLLTALRNQAGGDTPWRVAFPVLGSILPDVRKVAFLERHRGAHRFEVLDQEGEGPEVEQALLIEALDQQSTVTFVTEEATEAEQTMSAQSAWAVASPIQGLEGTSFLLYAHGRSFLARESLEEVAALVDVVAELVGHHMVVEAAAQYSSLLGIFGHHVGTLFKTSGALKLWSSDSTDPQTRAVLDNLMPIWGISQAISLHKKRGESEWADLLEAWVDPARLEVDKEVVEALRCLVGHTYHAGHGETAFLEWRVNGEEPLAVGLKSLPPLNDNPILLDKTVALTIGLIEMLSNVRKYPEARGAGREDRRELKELSQEERRVEIVCQNQDRVATVEVSQPVVTGPDGAVPYSRSLERICSLESSLLRGLVETGRAEKVAQTSLPHIVRTRQRWTYRWGRLVDEWRALRG